MAGKFHTILAAMLALTIGASVHAAEGDHPKGGGPGRQAQMLLDHAEDLGLSAEQKSKLQEMAKGPMSVLTDEQKSKVKELLGKAGGTGEKKMKKEKGDTTDTAKKPDEKKPDETKPDATKPDATK